jgi:hypothetical protein
MKSALTHSLFTRRALSLALLLSAVCFTALLFSPASSSEATAQRVGGATDVASLDTEALGLAAFKESVGGSVTPFVVELKGETGVSRKLAAEQQGQPVSVQDLGAHAQTLVTEQEAFLSSLPSRGVRALVRETNAMQIDGSVRRVRYEFTYLLNGFVAYVADADVERLRAMPEVASVSVAESPTYFLDKAIDYSLGTQQNPAERRTAVYGATKEFRPIDTGANPETPRPKIDGFEGQNMRIAVIDSGTDWRHPMFGGTGLLTPLPRVSGQPASPSDNKKIIYYFALSSPGDPTDDFGHGTLVASCAAGYSVNGDTPPRAGYGTGRDGTGVGPTLNGAELIGTAPQAQIMAYKVCGPAPQCPGDIPLSIEDAASPFTLVRSGSAGPTPVAKPIADVINLSLGDTSGDPAAPSRAQPIMLLWPAPSSSHLPATPDPARGQLALHPQPRWRFLSPPVSIQDLSLGRTCWPRVRFPLRHARQRRRDLHLKWVPAPTRMRRRRANARESEFSRSLAAVRCRTRGLRATPR